VDIEKMEGVIETMKSRGVELSGNHYSSVIVTRGCAMHDLDGALKVFDSLRHSKRQAVSSSLWPMGRMMRGPAAPRTALPDVLAYEALLTVLVTHHRIDLMQEYLDKMIQQDHVRPTAYINNLLIKGWASVGDLTAAREVFESMLDPAAGAAAPNNHAPHVGINGVQMPNSTITGSPTDPVYREVSTASLFLLPH
jgi:pentatricopeptide repeat protein